MKMSLLASVLYLHFVILLDAVGHTADLQDNTTYFYTPPFQASHVRVGTGHSQPFWAGDEIQREQGGGIFSLKAVPSGYLAFLIGVGVLITILSWGIYHCVKIQRKKQLRRRFFIQNGGAILSNRLSRSAVGQEFRLFEEEEIKIATANFSEDRILGRGGQASVYKGMLRDGTVVAVKKSKRVGRAAREGFIYEIAILSSVDHPNIVRLYGFCLEVENPQLIYEFVARGSLYYLLHVKHDEYLNSWSVRKQIMQEVADALRHLHSIRSPDTDGIFHRDVKSDNILMDGNYRSVLGDFGIAHMVGIGQDYVRMTHLVGSYGYHDPEMVRLGRYTEHSDVYSFGVVMAELITAERAPSDGDDPNGVGLADRFNDWVYKGDWTRLIDPRIRAPDNLHEIQWFAEVARACLRETRDNRPNMALVVRAMEEGPRIQI